MVDRQRAVAGDEAGDPFGMTQRHAQADHAAERLADDHGLLYALRVQHGQHVVGEHRQRQLIDRRHRAAEAAELHRQAGVATRELGHFAADR